MPIAFTFPEGTFFTQPDGFNIFQPQPTDGIMVRMDEKERLRLIGQPSTYATLQPQRGEHAERYIAALDKAYACMLMELERMYVSGGYTREPPDPAVAMRLGVYAQVVLALKAFNLPIIETQHAEKESKE